jgi:hypothetical protein
MGFAASGTKYISTGIVCTCTIILLSFNYNNIIINTAVDRPTTDYTRTHARVVGYRYRTGIT